MYNDCIVRKIPIKYQAYFKSFKRFFQPTSRRLLLVISVAFLTRLITYGFIKLPWIIYDEFIYLDTARQVIRGNFVSLLSLDPQLYPAGWPVILASFIGFIKNPFLQYFAGLSLTMLISVLVPVLAFIFTGSLWVSLLISFYPPLFVYSSSIMSETFYTFMLLLLLAVLKFIIRDDFAKRQHLILAAVVFAFFMFYTRMIRSFGVILLPSFLLATFLVNYFQYKIKSISRLKSLLFFSVLVAFFYYAFSYLSSLFLLPKNSFYERTAYVDALIKALKQPRLSFVLLRNELTLSLYWFLFILPIFFFVEAKKELHKKEWHLLLPRVWALFIYLFSLGLTFAHMFIGATKNPQYLVFSRYLDPALVILFVFMIADFIKYFFANVHLKISPIVLVIIGYFLFYFVFKLTKLDYKFGNTMSVYFFLLFENNPLLTIGLVGILIIVFYSFYQNKRQWLINSLVIFFVISSYLAISNTTPTPRWVIEKYSNVVTQWQQALNRYPTADIPLCLYADRISSEVYYLYHFINPYQYLRDCSLSTAKPRRIIMNKNHKKALPSNCHVDYRFSSGEAIVYCPLGY